MNLKQLFLAVLMTMALWFGGFGCGTAWRADDVRYTGRPGLKIEANTGGFGFYIGLDGQMVATGAADSGVVVEPEVTPGG